jgi:hypothetical protein
MTHVHSRQHAIRDWRGVTGSRERLLYKPVRLRNFGVLKVDVCVCKRHQIEDALFHKSTENFLSQIFEICAIKCSIAYVSISFHRGNAVSSSALSRLTSSVPTEMARLPCFNSSRGNAASIPPWQWARVRGWPSSPSALRCKLRTRGCCDRGKL